MGLTLLTIATLGALWLAPSWQDPFEDICHIASLLALLTVVILWITKAYGAVRVEVATAALFLFGMPGVYLIAWARQPASSSGWLWVELGGFALFGGFTAVGYFRNPWFLIIGIAAHGFAWDSWHYFTATPYIPRWYTIGCLILDVALSGYLAIRVPVWRAYANGQAAPRSTG